MPGHVIFSENRDKTDRVYLSELYPTSGIKFSHGLPGGPLAASWSFYAPPYYDHRALAQGRRIVILDGGGGRKWHGLATAPTPGNPWECQAEGLGALALRYRAFPIPITANYYDLNNVIGQAVTNRGLPWVIPTGMPVGVGTAGEQTPDMSIGELLNTVTEQIGQSWWINNSEQLVIGSPLAVPNYLFCPSDPGGGRALNEDYVSGFLVFYVDSATPTKTTIYFFGDAARESKFGHTEQSLDLTDQGPMTQAQMIAASQAALNLHPPRVPFSGQFDLTFGQVLSAPGGVPVDLSAVLPPATGRIAVTDRDHAAEIDPSQPTMVWVTMTEYDDDLDVLTVTPWDSSGDGFKQWLADRKAWRSSKHVRA